MAYTGVDGVMTAGLLHFTTVVYCVTSLGGGEGGGVGNRYKACRPVGRGGGCDGCVCTPHKPWKSAYCEKSISK